MHLAVTAPHLYAAIVHDDAGQVTVTVTDTIQIPHLHVCDHVNMTG
jgi:hypothetical protein